MKLGIVLEVAIVFLGITSPAEAETKRVRLPVSALPRQDQPIQVDAKAAMLPDGVREGGAVPASWKTMLVPMMSDDFGHCTDDRRGSVGSSNNEETSTEKIWEANGKVFFDRARIKIEDGKVHVVSAERVPVVYVTESIWAYRSGATIRIVTGRDVAVFARAVFWGCSVDETLVALPSGTASVTSSPNDVNEVLRSTYEVTQGKSPKPGSWKGVEFALLATVSKASADEEPMLNLVIKRP